MPACDDRGLQLGAVLLFLLAAAPAAAQPVSCGDTIGPKAKVTLTADVGPCTSADGDAVHVTGPATFDLAGFTISCDPNDPSNGLLIDGKGAKVMGGTIENCVSGLDLTGGEGKHKVEDVLVRNSTTDGVAINSDKNKLKRVASLNSSDDGFDVDGDGTKIDDAEAVDNGTGFEVGGSGTKLTRIAASNNHNGLVVADGAAGTKVKDCRLTMNAGVGALLEDDAKLDKCLASGNGLIGFLIEGDGNELKKCLALDNAQSGVFADPGADGNTVKQCVALGNETDLEDTNPGCGTNTWQKNKFGSRDPDDPCIQ